MEEQPNIDDVLRWLHRGVTDAATVAVGLGVLGINRAQVVRRELKRVLCESPGEEDIANASTNTSTKAHEV